MQFLDCIGRRRYILESFTWEANMNLCPGKSVGAIIRDPSGAFLVLSRKKYPRGLALPAGHILINEGEKPEEAMCREVLEETGIQVKRYRELLHRIFPNECSRLDENSKNYNGHEWWVYEVLEWEGEPCLREPDKHDFVSFMPLPELLKPTRLWDPAWREYILPALGII
jgi:8-oxo-dGTP pyrophosphatase MutT (NUDIX family)